MHVTKYNSMYLIVNIINEYSDKPTAVSVWDGMQIRGVFD